MILKLATATPNIVIRVTPMTTPIVVRELRSGYRSAFSAARRADGERPSIRPTNRRAGGMNRWAPTTKPVNERTPPTTPISTPIGFARPTTTPSARNANPSTMRMIAAPLRFGRARVCSRESSCEPPIACSGVTVSTRREPTQEASQVVSTTPTIGTSSSGSFQP